MVGGRRGGRDIYYKCDLSSISCSSKLEVRSPGMFDPLSLSQPWSFLSIPIVWLTAELPTTVPLPPCRVSYTHPLLTPPQKTKGEDDEEHQRLPTRPVRSLHVVLRACAHGFFFRLAPLVPTPGLTSPASRLPKGSPRRCRRV